jgi:cyanate permease
MRNDDAQGDAHLAVQLRESERRMDLASAAADLGMWSWDIVHDSIWATSKTRALFGFSVGNLITLPALIVQREFDPRAFGVLVSLITAINQITYAFGPGVIGLLHDLSGSYTLPFYGCIGLELIAAVTIMTRGRSQQRRL